MFMTWIRSMLGPLSSILDYFSAQPDRLLILLVIWALIYFMGLLQLKRIEARTINLVLRESALHQKENPDASAEDLYQKIYPVWAAEFANWKVYFIPHRHDLWPVRATLKNAAAKLPFTPEWITSILTKHNTAQG